ncbi:hypothetical protein KAU55_03985, partial [Candidatus Bathyarchaeota archaeon]|nr:hypothetical protein [Candidatus Bathyarchaeota archaeon]
TILTPRFPSDSQRTLTGFPTNLNQSHVPLDMHRRKACQMTETIRILNPCHKKKKGRLECRGF